MKKLLLIVVVLMVAYTSYAQSRESVPQMAQSSIPNKDAKFLLFPTKNLYIFLKLDTSTGELWMVQYSTGEKDESIEVKISSWLYPIVSEAEAKPGRFFLYPTFNMYNFILIDQVDGRIWQAQWSIEPENRGIMRIY